MSDLVARAEAIAKQAHHGQKRNYGGAPYHTHPERVAALVAGLPGATDVDVAAAWLHDVLEDTDYPAEQIEAQVGADVLRLVRELTDPSAAPQWKDRSRQEKRKADWEHLAGVSDRAKRIKMCNLLDNLRDMAAAPKGFARLYLTESRQVLGMLRHVDPDLAREVDTTLGELEVTLTPTPEPPAGDAPA